MMVGLEDYGYDYHGYYCYTCLIMLLNSVIMFALCML
jgi:hypothetical protein